ncbi:histidine phosphatase superfamily [Gongronella butleri]|nr:histidine phosphatase superfamily [Gongronella butleri]
MNLFLAASLLLTCVSSQAAMIQARDGSSSSNYAPWTNALPSNYNVCQASTPTGSSYKAVPNATLRFAQVIVRHGARTSTVPLLEDNATWFDCGAALDTVGFSTAGKPLPIRGISTQQRVFTTQGEATYDFAVGQGNCDIGQLTDLGKTQHKALGSHLRDVYVDKTGLLPKNYKDGALYLRTTSVWRTKESAQSVLQGLYPPEAVPLRSPPVPMYTMAGEDTMSPVPTYCPALAAMTEQMATEDAWVAFNASQSDFTTRVGPILGYPASEFGWQAFGAYFDILSSRHCHKKALPCQFDPHTGTRQGSKPCADDNDLETATKDASFSAWRWPMRDSSMAKKYLTLYGGGFFNDLKTELQAVIKNGTKRGHALSLYSAHDNTVVMLLGAFNASDDAMLWPPFASNLIFELWEHQNGGNHTVRVLYNGQVLQLQPKDPWCDLNACDATTFMDRLAAYIPTNLATACGA